MTTRRHPRFAITLEVLVRFDDAEAAVAARLVNVSRDGLFVTMDPPRPVGTRVRALFKTRAGLLGVEGVVVRVQPDPEDPSTHHLPSGVGVFLTASDAGFESWCAAIAPVPAK
jgi:hypothetical protein